MYLSLMTLALSTIGALLRDATAIHWSDTADLLRNADLTAIEEQLPSGQRSFFRAIDVSVKRLPVTTRKRYESLAVLPDDTPARLEVLATLWHATHAETRRVARLLLDRSLAQ